MSTALSHRFSLHNTTRVSSSSSLRNKIILPLSRFPFLCLPYSPNTLQFSLYCALNFLSMFFLYFLSFQFSFSFLQFFQIALEKRKKNFFFECFCYCIFNAFMQNKRGLLLTVMVWFILLGCLEYF